MKDTSQVAIEYNIADPNLSRMTVQISIPLTSGRIATRSFAALSAEIRSDLVNSCVQGSIQEGIDETLHALFKELRESLGS